ncbi:ABC transporter substrate-binding protein [Hippea jasoniae]|uniref:ABC transporter substrate-binding protein n=1 Tax=Hippea jasoniae TaxID=944479 RepID=UPI00055424B6|nr:helical backbone metal receptor [Hippea jasoniae]
MKAVVFFVIFFASFISNALALRIASFSVPATEAIVELKKADELVACSKFARLPEGLKVARMGSITNVSVEELLRLKVDVVFVSSLMNRKVVSKLKSLHIKVIEFSYPRSFEDICADMIEVGRIVGKPKEAEKIVNQAKKQVERIENKLKNTKPLKVFVQIGANPLYTATKHSFINDFIRFANAINIAANAKSGLYSVEEVLRQNPDAIIISQMGFNGYKQKKFWMQFKFLKAVKNNRILILDDNSLCSPTPITFVKTLRKIAKFLHPEVDIE